MSQPLSDTQELLNYQRLIALKFKASRLCVISHKLKEINTNHRRRTILRSGRTMGVYNTADISEADLPLNGWGD
jgi:simple sugar transport system ATP-binding protein